MKSTKQSKKQADNQVSKSVFKEAILSVKANKRGLSAPLCMFVVFTLLSLCLAYVSMPSLILTVPFVIAPSYFAYYASGTMDLRDKSETAAFFILFKAYFNRLFSGSFRILMGFLKAFLIFLLSNTVLFLVLEVTVFNGIPEYAQLMESLNSNAETMSSMINELNQLMETNALFGNLMFVCSVFGFACGTVEFLHHVSYETPKLDFDLIRQAPVPMRGFHVIDKMVKKQNKKTFFFEYFKATWFIDLLILIGFGGAGALEFFVLKGAQIDYAFVLGLAINIILLLPFFNYLSEVFHILFARHRQSYEINFTNFTLQLLSKYQNKLGLDEKEADALKEFLNQNTENKDEKKKDNEK